MKKFFFPSVVILVVAAFGASALAKSVDKVLEKSHSNPVAPVEATHAETQESTEQEQETTEQETEGDGINHGHCVSYWAHQSKTAGLKGKARGGFISTIAQNKDAVSKKVADGGNPDATCDFRAALEAAKTQAATATSEHGKSQEHKGQGKTKDHGH
ncbi:MAG: hypothetical protein ABIS18_06275 [Actinomycetota bacterium]